MKTPLAPALHDQLRDDLQRATVAALVGSRRWQPGELAFQGGTCLHLVHGSARFSEDLDFLVRGGLSLAALANQVAARLDPGPRVPAGLQVSVRPSREDRNPHAFDVVLSGPDVLGSVRVKVELWQAPQEVLRQLQVVVRPLAGPAGLQTSVPSLPLAEILADKVYAFGARDRLKPRDLYDLHWLAQDGQPRPEGVAAPLLTAALLTRLRIYPQPGGELGTARWWAERASQRCEQMAAPAQPRLVSEDLRRWLPAGVPMDEDIAKRMLEHAQGLLHQGVAMVRAHELALRMGEARAVSAEGRSEVDYELAPAAHRPTGG